MSSNSIPGLIADIELGKRSLNRILQHQAEVLARTEVEPKFFLDRCVHRVFAGNKRQRG